MVRGERGEQGGEGDVGSGEGVRRGTNDTNDRRERERIIGQVGLTAVLTAGPTYCITDTLHSHALLPYI
jgi:hypothetical protein